MSKSLIQLYYFIVCLISAITIMITLGVAFNSITEYKFASSLNKFSSNNKYYKHKIQYSPNNKKTWNMLNDEEIKTKRTIEKEDFLKGKKSEAFSAIISYITWLFVATLFFIAHWGLQKNILYKINYSKICCRKSLL